MSNSKLGVIWQAGTGRVVFRFGTGTGRGRIERASDAFGGRQGDSKKAKTLPPPGCFFAKSLDPSENKGVVFLVMGKRVCKNIKIKNLSVMASNE
jgi:hypothetical protein